jgi:hypothetical protein
MLPSPFPKKYSRQYSSPCSIHKKAVQFHPKQTGFPNGSNETRPKRALWAAGKPPPFFIAFYYKRFLGQFQFLSQPNYFPESPLGLHSGGFSLII